MEFLNWQSGGDVAILALVLYGLVLLGAVAFVARRDASLTRLLPWAFLWHFIIWLFIAFWMQPHYAALDQADNYAYHNLGLDTASWIRSGQWQYVSPDSLGSDMVPILTGVLYAPFGGDVYGMMFFSACVGLCAAIYFCRAFGLWATPQHFTSYSRIILFLPSFAVWTSSFGKDSWVSLGLAMSAYGYSAILKRTGSRGPWYLAGGMLMVTAIRPHVSLLLSASMAMAFFWGMFRTRRGSLLIKMTTAVLLVALAGFMTSITLGFLKIADTSADGVAEYMQQRESGNFEGGSAVEIEATQGPIGMLLAFPRGVVRVLFEPFPWEVNGFASALAGAENIFILWFVLNSARRLKGLLRGIGGEPYLLFSVLFAFLILFMLALTPNLGLISRQRAMLLPFLFAPLVAARAKRTQDSELVGAAEPLFDYASQAHFETIRR